MICDFPIGILFLVLPPSGFLAENSVNIWSADAYTLFMPFEYGNGNLYEFEKWSKPSSYRDYEIWRKFSIQRIDLYTHFCSIHQNLLKLIWTYGKPRYLQGQGNILKKNRGVPTQECSCLVKNGLIFCFFMMHYEKITRFSPWKNGEYTKVWIL